MFISLQVDHVADYFCPCAVHSLYLCWKLPASCSLLVFKGIKKGMQFYLSSVKSRLDIRHSLMSGLHPSLGSFPEQLLVIEPTSNPDEE